MNFHCTPTTLKDCVEDLLDGDETCEVLYPVHRHQSSKKLGISLGIVHVEGQLAETIPNITVYMRVESVVKDLVACFILDIILYIRYQCLLQAYKCIINPLLSRPLKLITIFDKFLAVLATVSYRIAIRTTMEL